MHSSQNIIGNKRGEQMKILVKPVLKIPDGSHRGVIKTIQYRTKPYEYTDLVIQFPIDGKQASIKAGFPTMVTPESKLGKLLTAFGAILEVGKEIEPEATLIERNVTFMTISNKTERGTFANVVPNSIKPA